MRGTNRNKTGCALALTAQIWRISAGDRVEPQETVRRHKSGRLVDVSLSASPIVGHDGRFVGASKIVRDITARKEVERIQGGLVAELNHRVGVVAGLPPPRMAASPAGACLLDTILTFLITSQVLENSSVGCRLGRPPIPCAMMFRCPQKTALLHLQVCF
ncbi:PAS domain S-box protein [Mycoplana sp. BE70]|uniref:PAS domain S-box protein n=1 Tax=Mycoplana sp. BE70 TaxID=2817775 RepID=UPI0038621149